MNKIIRIVPLLCFLIANASSAKKFVKDVIGFPEQEENINLLNKENRQPVYLPSMCPVNELYYPGDQQDDWICDCRPAYLYHPGSGACWPSFRRGPCPDGQYLVLPTNSVLPVCQRNPCHVDTYVLWNNNCEKLGSTRPCGNLFPAAALDVNATTLLVNCVKLNVESRFTETESLCLPGCKRSINGKCKVVQK